MLERTLNLGILAHVDAGKTTLTERLLYAAGVIDEVGSVDDGTTQTDSLALEQRRGITIKAAVVSFAIDDVMVNLIDTPGHPDFIAEVERVLGVLDGAVLVVSAVEGVQSQTPLLWRALQRLSVPTLIFVNKTDRAGADADRVQREIAERLSASVVPMDPVGFRARAAELLAEHDDALLAAYVDGDLDDRRLRAALSAQAGQCLVHPVFTGSARTGAGVEALMSGIAVLLPPSSGDAAGPSAGTVFKIERGSGGEKLAYVRMFSGTVRTRDRLRVGGGEEKVTAIRVFDRGGPAQRDSVSAGRIAKLAGLASIQIGDRIGDAPAENLRPQFPPPTLEAVAEPADGADAARLRAALEQLAEQDPLIGLRQDDRGRLSVSLYGEVQKEVIEATLADEYGVAVELGEATPIYVERPRRTGEALEMLNAETNPFRATIGFRVERADGFELRIPVDHRRMPIYVYKRRESFEQAIAQYVRETMQEGLYGWEVRDCAVTMTDCNYSSPDGPQSVRGPLSTAADFRKLAPVVLMRALQAGGTVVCEPTVRVELEVPTEALGAVVSALVRLEATFEPPEPDGRVAAIRGVLSATRVDALRRELPGLTGGEGVLESTFAGYEPVSGDPPTRPRTTPNPLDLREYVRAVR